MNLPTFKYHPDPIKTGSIKESNNICLCCRKNRGYIYTGSVYAEENLEECICPWCIADGSAHKKFGAEFTDFESIGYYGCWEKIPKTVVEEIAFRTPGFRGWQQERWWTHCEDGAEFLGYAGKEEVETLGPDFSEYIRSELGLRKGKEWNSYYNALDKDYGPTVYVFRCRKCSKLGGYSDNQ